MLRYVVRVGASGAIRLPKELLRRLDLVGGGDVRFRLGDAGAVLEALAKSRSHALTLGEAVLEYDSAGSTQGRRVLIPRASEGGSEVAEAARRPGCHQGR